CAWSLLASSVVRRRATQQLRGRWTPTRSPPNSCCPQHVVSSPGRSRMPHAEIVRQLVTELERVGVDPDQMVAGLTSRAEDALRGLRVFTSGPGPAHLHSEIT